MLIINATVDVFTDTDYASNFYQHAKCADAKQFTINDQRQPAPLGTPNTPSGRSARF